MTVFTAMILLLVASLLFTLLESARVSGLHAKAEMNAMLCTDSAFAEYDATLFENYDLLFLDLGYGNGAIELSKLKERMLELGQENLNPKKRLLSGSEANLYRMNVIQAVMEEYELATDDGGNAFYRQVTETAKRELPEAMAEHVLGEIGDTTDVSTAVENPESGVNEANGAITQARAQKSEEDRAKQERGEAVEPLPDVENPIEFMMTLKTSGILALVTEQPQELSAKEMDLSDALYKRELQKGTAAVGENEGAFDRVWYQMYLSNHFGYYTEQKENRVLDYELEYMIGGKSSDKENLESVVNRLLVAREAANVFYLLQDATKMEEALGVATALVGFTGNPIAVELVKAGIVAAWAYVESILDIRTLLAGGKIALVKTQADWVTDILHISESFANAGGARENENGLAYGAYLQEMLFLQNKSELNFRVMNLMEKNVRVLCANEKWRMDSMAQEMKVVFTYEAHPLFFRLVTIGNIQNNAYTIEEKQQISYLNSK